jgi:hypothetical protein
MRAIFPYLLPAKSGWTPRVPPYSPRLLGNPSKASRGAGWLKTARVLGG